jgi:hypothetical protein
VAEDGLGDEPTQLETAEGVIGNHETSAEAPEGRRVVELLEEERTGALTPITNGFSGKDYRTFQAPDEASDDGSIDQAPCRVESPSGSVLSNPDDSLSVQVPYLLRDETLANCLRGLFFPLQEVAYFHLWHQDQDWAAQRPHFDHSIAASSHGWPPPHSCLRALLPLRFWQIILDKLQLAVK